MRTIPNLAALAVTIPLQVDEPVVCAGEIYISTGLTPGAFEKVSASGAWVRYSVTGAQFVAASADPTSDVSSTVDLVSLPPWTSVVHVVMSVSELFASLDSGLDGRAGLDVQFLMSLTGPVPVGSHYELPVSLDPLTDPVSEVINERSPLRLFKGESGVLQVALHTNETQTISEVADGVFNVWIMQSVLPQV